MCISFQRNIAIPHFISHFKKVSFSFHFFLLWLHLFPSSFSHSHKYDFDLISLIFFFSFFFLFHQKIERETLREKERERKSRARNARKVETQPISKTIRFIRNPNPNPITSQIDGFDDESSFRLKKIFESRRSVELSGFDLISIGEIGDLGGCRSDRRERGSE